MKKNKTFVIGLIVGSALAVAGLTATVALLTPQKAQADGPVDTSWICVKKCAGSSNPEACHQRCNAKPSQTPIEPAGVN